MKKIISGGTGEFTDKKSRFIANIYHIEDEDILSAIECHTTLKKEMNDYDKIIFLADKLA